MSTWPSQSASSVHRRRAQRAIAMPFARSPTVMACGGYSNRAFSGRVMRFNKGIAANTTSVERASPPSMVR